MKRYFLSLLFLIISAAQAAACGWLGFDTAAPRFILAPLQDMLPGYSDKWIPEEWDDREMVISEWKQHLNIPKNDKAAWLENVLYGFRWTYDDAEDEANSKKRLTLAKSNITDTEDLAYLMPVIERSIKLQDMWGGHPELTEEQYAFWKSKALASGINPFLKRRYAYQAIKAANRLGHHEEAIRMFAEIPGTGNGTDSVYFRSWSIYCSSLAASGDSRRAVTECMNMYMAHPEQRFGIRSFLINKIGEKEKQEYVADSAVDVKKRAMLAWLDGNLEKALELEPSNDRARKMLYDRVRMLDEKCVPRLWYWFTSGNKISYGLSGYAEEIATLKRVLAGLLVRDKGARSEVFYRTMSGYLMLLENDLAGAGVQLDKAISIAGENSAAAKQARLLKLVAHFAGTAASDAAFQERVIRDMDIFGMDRDIMYALLADRFIHNRDRVRAALSIGMTEEYSAYMDYLIDYKLSMEELDMLAQIAAGRALQPIDGMLSRKLPFTADDITYTKAMRYVKDLDYAKAYELLDSIKTPGYWPAPGKFEEHSEFGPRGWLTKGAIIYPDHSDLEKEVRVNKKELVRMLRDIAAGFADNEQGAANYIKAADIYRGCCYIPYNDVIWNGNRVWTFSTHLYNDYWNLDGALAPGNYEVWSKIKFGFSHDNLLTAAEYYAKAAAITKDIELAAECLGYAANLKADCGMDASEELGLLYDKYRSTVFYKAYSNTCTVINNSPTPQPAGK